ncbi:hypothetical protein LINPERHAP2_LOCUS15660 [Linum perenne]
MLLMMYVLLGDVGGGSEIGDMDGSDARDDALMFDDDPH